MKSEITASIVFYKTDINQAIGAIKCVLSTSNILKLILVDNSPDDRLSTFASLDDRVVYIFNPSNPGFGAGHNMAIRKSIESKVKYHVVLNADINFEQGVLETLYTYMEANPDVGHVMPKVLYPDGEIQYLCKLLPTPMDLIFRRFVPFKHWKEKRNKSYELRFTGYQNEMEAPYLSGCFMFLRVSALEEIGLFDEKYFMYPEDIDLTRRMNEKYRTMFYPSVYIIHAHGKESYKNIIMLGIHIWNIIKYFNKWGWLIDPQRKATNKKILEDLCQQYNK